MMTTIIDEGASFASDNNMTDDNSAADATRCTTFRAQIIRPISDEHRPISFSRYRRRTTTDRLLLLILLMSVPLTECRFVTPSVHEDGSPSRGRSPIHTDIDNLRVIHTVRTQFDKMSDALSETMLHNSAADATAGVPVFRMRHQGETQHARRKHEEWQRRHPAPPSQIVSPTVFSVQATQGRPRHHNGCAPNTVLCPSSSHGRYARCVRVNQLCDGRADCPRGEDEHRLNCMYHKATMTTLHQLKSLVDSAIEPMLQSVQDVWTQQLRTDDRLARAEL